MKIGAIFPTTELGSDTAVIRDWTQTAEDLGYAHVMAYDHVVGAVHEGREPALTGPYTERDDFHEPMVLFAYMAAMTRSLEFATGVMILPQRQTVMVAKQAAELANLSEGRFRLGVGTGWNYVEYDSLAVPFAGRGKRMDEQVELLRALWADTVIDFDGRYHRVERAGIKPLPRYPIPIWFGGFSRVARDRAVRVGDGFFFATGGERVRQQWQQLRQDLEAAGRDPDAFHAEIQLDYSQGPEVWRAEVDAWAEAGGTHVSLRAMDVGAEFMGMQKVGYQGPQDYLRALEEFIKVVG